MSEAEGLLNKINCKATTTSPTRVFSPLRIDMRYRNLIITEQLSCSE